MGNFIPTVSRRPDPEDKAGFWERIGEHALTTAITQTIGVGANAAEQYTKKKLYDEPERAWKKDKYESEITSEEKIARKRNSAAMQRHALTLYSEALTEEMELEDDYLDVMADTAKVKTSKKWGNRPVSGGGGKGGTDTKGLPTVSANDTPEVIEVKEAAARIIKTELDKQAAAQEGLDESSAQIKQIYARSGGSSKEHVPKELRDELLAAAKKAKEAKRKIIIAKKNMLRAYLAVGIKSGVFDDQDMARIPGQFKQLAESIKNKTVKRRASSKITDEATKILGTNTNVPRDVPAEAKSAVEALGESGAQELINRKERQIGERKGLDHELKIDILRNSQVTDTRTAQLMFGSMTYIDTDKNGNKWLYIDPALSGAAANLTDKGKLPLSRGMAGETVADAQMMLRRIRNEDPRAVGSVEGKPGNKMFLEVKTNGTFDKTTESAVREFQEKYASTFGLRPTGRVDSKTAEALNILSSEEGPIATKKTTLGESNSSPEVYEKESKKWKDAKAFDADDGKTSEEVQEEQNLRGIGRRVEGGREYYWSEEKNQWQYTGESYELEEGENSDEIDIGEETSLLKDKLPQSEGFAFISTPAGPMPNPALFALTVAGEGEGEVEGEGEGQVPVKDLTPLQKTKSRLDKIQVDHKRANPSHYQAVGSFFSEFFDGDITVEDAKIFQETLDTNSKILASSGLSQGITATEVLKLQNKAVESNINIGKKYYGLLESEHSGAMGLFRTIFSGHLKTVHIGEIPETTQIELMRKYAPSLATDGAVTENTRKQLDKEGAKLFEDKKRAKDFVNSFITSTEQWLQKTAEQSGDAKFDIFAGTNVKFNKTHAARATRKLNVLIEGSILANIDTRFSNVTEGIVAKASAEGRPVGELALELFPGYVYTKEVIGSKKTDSPFKTMSVEEITKNPQLWRERVRKAGIRQAVLAIQQSSAAQNKISEVSLSILRGTTSVSALGRDSNLVVKEAEKSGVYAGRKGATANAKAKTKDGIDSTYLNDASAQISRTTGRAIRELIKNGLFPFIPRKTAYFKPGLED